MGKVNNYRTADAVEESAPFIENLKWTYEKLSASNGILPQQQLLE